MAFIRHLRWNQWNITHISRHGVIPEEVEELCNTDPLVQKGKKGRILIIGPISSGRTITAVLDLEGQGNYYPVTARIASRKERKLYKQEKEVQENDKREESDS